MLLVAISCYRCGSGFGEHLGVPHILCRGCARCLHGHVNITICVSLCGCVCVFVCTKVTTGYQRYDVRLAIHEQWVGEHIKLYMSGIAAALYSSTAANFQYAEENQGKEFGFCAKLIQIVGYLNVLVISVHVRWLEEQIFFAHRLRWERSPGRPCFVLTRLFGFSKRGDTSCLKSQLS